MLEHIFENFKALLLIIENWESGEKKTVDIHQIIFMQKAVFGDSLIIISITILARFLTVAHFVVKFWLESWDIKMRNLFNIGKKMLSSKRDRKKRNFRKEKKLPKTSCFPPTCARAFPQLRWCNKKRFFISKRSFLLWSIVFSCQHSRPVVLISTRQEKFEWKFEKKKKVKLKENVKNCLEKKLRLG